VRELYDLVKWGPTSANVSPGRKGLDKELFSGTAWRANFLCNLGYGADDALLERLPRLDFDEACQIL
jgi:hypothetical protein